ncbi:MAG: enoyl-ACP reductase [Phycisphaerae bacterium]
MDFLGLTGKTILVMGVANKRSVAYHVARVLEDTGAQVVYSVRSDQRAQSLTQLLGGKEVHVCDVEHDDQITALAHAVAQKHPRIHGIIHSIAFANYEHFSGTFHEVRKQDFLQAVDVSCFSLIAVANAFKDLLDPRASVVTISISTSRMTVESYGYMAPAKAALDSAIAFLAKSFSGFSKVRFNAVGAGLLKTSASAGIPGYVDNYLFAEQATLRREALTTEEVANVAAFLLSERSSGINAQTVVVDAGMGTNYFDANIVKHTVAGVWPTESS